MSFITGFYPIVDASLLTDQSAYTLAEFFLGRGYKALQLRLKNYSKADFIAIAQEIYYLKLHNDFKFILNHHVDVAAELGADGVHLTHESLSIKEARKILGPGKIIGVSVHSKEEASRAEEEGADYVTLGAIYKTTSKSADYPVLGTDVLKETCHTLSIPVFAVGGISPENVQQVMDAGARGYCMLSHAL